MTTTPKSMTYEEWLRGFEPDDFDHVPFGCDYEYASPDVNNWRVRPINLPLVLR